MSYENENFFARLFGTKPPQPETELGQALELLRVALLTLDSQAERSVQLAQAAISALADSRVGQFSTIESVVRRIDDDDDDVEDGDEFDSDCFETLAYYRTRAADAETKLSYLHMRIDSALGYSSTECWQGDVDESRYHADDYYERITMLRAAAKQVVTEVNELAKSESNAS